MTTKNTPRYIPALRFGFLTGIYDPLVKLTTREAHHKNLLIETAGISPGSRVLDLGCGTGTLAIMIKQRVPDAEVFGLDGDPKALEIARKKIADAGVQASLTEAMSYDPPFEPGSFDRVVSSLLFHHLTTENKLRTLDSSRRLLKPGGEIHILDWGRPHNIFMRLAFLVERLLDGFESTADSVTGRFPSLMEDAGFLSVTEPHRLKTMLGSLSIYSATSPATSA
ncbi:MAG: class I SAM-dependent methyltransferase [Planctomycetes bacterium]|nr:class I SAM-dependent methyltransferase [Planctomycetota bacterium]